jgi:hypothetical protein
MNPTVVAERRILADASTKVQKEIAAGDLDAKVVTHARQVENLIAKHRPDLYTDLGGENGVYERALAKGRLRKGVAEELKRLKTDLSEPELVSNDDVAAYLTNPSITLREIGKDIETVIEGLEGVVQPNLLRSDVTKAITKLTELETALVESGLGRQLA